MSEYKIESPSVAKAPFKSPLRIVAALPRAQASTPVRLFPIVFFLCYLSSTVFLFIFGPWDWPVHDGKKLYIFLTLAHLALLAGYCTAVFREPTGYSGRFRLHNLVRWTVFINLFLLLPTISFRTGSVIPDLGQALADPGAAYSGSLATRDAGIPIVEYFRLLAGPLTALFLPLVVFYWRFIGRPLRTASVLVITGTILMFIAMGTNKAIADTLLLLPFIVVAAYWAGVIRLNLRKFVFGLIFGAVCFAAFFSFYSGTVSSRPGSPAFYGYFPAIGIRANPNNFLLTASPPAMKIGVLGLDSYLTQGYYALYLSLDEPFVPMFGIGNSFFLTRQAERISGSSELSKLSYPARIEKDGWNSVLLWSSIYPWIASDVSFPGTILVVFLIGRFFALSWLDTLDGTNPFAIALFAQFALMLFYFPANNQLLQSGEGLTGFIGIFCLWAFTRKKYGSVSKSAVQLGLN